MTTLALSLCALLLALGCGARAGRAELSADTADGHARHCADDAGAKLKTAKALAQKVLKHF